MNAPHPCSIPPNLLDRCRCCGTGFIRRDEGSLARGFCGESCEYQTRQPVTDPRDQRPPPEDKL